jgi:LysM repeat protein
MIKKPLQALGLFCVALISMAVFLPVTASAPLPQINLSTPTPGADGRIVYIVKENDTCTSISLLMGITEQDLRELNNLQNNSDGDDCSFLWVGQELIIREKPQETPTPTPEVQVEPTATPFKGNGTICIYLFNDENGDALAQETELPIAGGAVSLTDRLSTINETGTTIDSGESLCFADIPEGDYNISVAIPEGYNPTTVMNYSLTLSAGQVSTIDFGAQPGSGLQPVFGEESSSPMLLIVGILFVVIGVGLWFYVRRMT